MGKNKKNPSKQSCSDKTAKHNGPPKAALKPESREIRDEIRVKSAVFRLHKSIKGFHEDCGTISEAISTLQFRGPNATVFVSNKATVNLGNYESATIEYGVSVPCYLEEIDSASLFAERFVEGKLSAEINRIKSGPRPVSDVSKNGNGDSTVKSGKEWHEKVKYMAKDTGESNRKEESKKDVEEESSGESWDDDLAELEGNGEDVAESKDSSKCDDLF